MAAVAAIPAVPFVVGQEEEPPSAEHPALKAVISGLIGAGLMPGIALVVVYAILNGGNAEEKDADG